jgi:hypothetical protein
MAMARNAESSRPFTAKPTACRRRWRSAQGRSGTFEFATHISESHGSPIAVIARLRACSPRGVAPIPAGACAGASTRTATRRYAIALARACQVRWCSRTWASELDPILLPPPGQWIGAVRFWLCDRIAVRSGRSCDHGCRECLRLTPAVLPASGRRDGCQHVVARNMHRGEITRWIEPGTAAVFGLVRTCSICALGPE